MDAGPLIHSDCDSEGNPPPGDVPYVDPASLDDTEAAPPRGNERIDLPFYQPPERPRLRDEFESRVAYEDWVDDTKGGPQGQRGAKEAGAVVKLDDDSDFPVGRPHFWHAYCPRCTHKFHPDIPGAWTCPRCDGKVWQQPGDPESKACAVCRRSVAPLVYVGGHRLHNPISLNPHLCKRCGRVVCDHCYAPTKIDVSEYGFNSPQRVCVRCTGEAALLQRPPSDDDLGTLHEEQVVGDVHEAALFNPHWPPKCARCNITFAEPPKRWCCTSCAQPVWQPVGGRESTQCWLCADAAPSVRCHKCGQLACPACAPFEQPLPELGWSDGQGRSVCRACYGGSVDPRGADLWRAVCPQCKAVPSAPPAKWISTCHKKKCWQPDDAAESAKCSVCRSAVGGSAREHCRRCGRVVCLPCSQFKEPVPDRGFPAGAPQVVCRRCFRPDAALAPDHSDYPHWPPRCPRCERTWSDPPPRWRCHCGPVWQPNDHVASKGCWCCGRGLGGGSLNCRKCGRLVCSSCGQEKAELPHLGFTRGVQYPVCVKCVRQPR